MSRLLKLTQGSPKPSKVESSLIPKSGDTTMKEASGVTVLDSGLGLPAFFSCFDS